MNINEIVKEIISKGGAFDREEMIKNISKNWNVSYNPHKGDILSMFNESVSKRAKNFTTIESMKESENIVDVLYKLADYLGEGSFGDFAQRIFEDDKAAYQIATDIVDVNPFCFIKVPSNIAGREQQTMAKTIERFRPLCQIKIDGTTKTFQVADGKKASSKHMNAIEETTTLIMEKLNIMQKTKAVKFQDMSDEEKAVSKAVATLIVLNTIADESELDTLAKVEDFYAPMIFQMMLKIKDTNKPISRIRETSVYLAQKYMDTIDSLRATFKGREPIDYFHDSKIINALSKAALKNADMNADISGKGRKLAYVNVDGELEVLPEAARVEMSNVKEMLKSNDISKVLGAFNALDKQLFAEDRIDLVKDSISDTAAIMFANLIVLENTEGINEEIKYVLEQAFMIPFMQSTATLSSLNISKAVAEAFLDVDAAAEANYVEVNMKNVFSTKDSKTEDVETAEGKKIPDFNGMVKTTETFSRAKEFSKAVNILKTEIDKTLTALNRDSRTAERKKNNYKTQKKQDEQAFNQKVSDILIRDILQINGFLDKNKNINAYYLKEVKESRGLRKELIALLDDQKGKINNKISKLQEKYGYEEGQEIDKEDLENARTDVGLDKVGMGPDIQKAMEDYKNDIIKTLKNQTEVQPAEAEVKPEEPEAQPVEPELNSEDGREM